MIKDISVNSLLYADDITLLSSSENGLQRSLDVLNEFRIENCKLDVNNEKSKVMVFNSNRKSLVNIFKYKYIILKTVKSYCYLGVTIKFSGAYCLLQLIVNGKCRKVFLRLKKSIGLNNPCGLL